LLFSFAAGGTLWAADGGLSPVGAPPRFPILEHPAFLALFGGCLLLTILLFAARRRLAEQNRTLERKVAERTAGLEADLRRRESLEKALVESEERFARAFNHGPMLATISAAATGRVLAANQRFCECLGYSREELLGQRTTDLGVWLNPRQRDELLRRVNEGEDITNREVQIRARDGRVLTVLVSFERVTLGAEDCLLIFGVDITERRAVERRLQASEEMFSRAFRHNPLMAAIT
jgi:PAS domain S-box-containing protein